MMFRKLLNKSFNFVKLQNYRNFCKKNEVDIEKVFTSPQVQSLLLKITGCDLEKILKAKPVKEMEPPKYKLLTDQQLEELNKEAVTKAKSYLQMPPYMKPWQQKQSDDVLSEDKEINLFEKEGSSYVFTDISPGIHPRVKKLIITLMKIFLKHRTVVIREPNGLLRKADRKEKVDVLNIYYPQEHRMYKTPQMFDHEPLEKLLNLHRYEYILTRTCIQFEPDDPEFIRIIERTYEHINSHKQFDTLRSTRFFGHMCFYLLTHKNIDDLLIDMLNRNLIDDAGCLIILYNIVSSPSSFFSSPTQLPSSLESKKNENLIMEYIDKESKDKGGVKGALEACLIQKTKQASG